MNLTDPTADYCAECAKILTEHVKTWIREYYKFWRSLGCTAIDAIALARTDAQETMNKCNLGVNFDGPMA